RTRRTTLGAGGFVCPACQRTSNSSRLPGCVSLSMSTAACGHALKHGAPIQWKRRRRPSSAISQRSFRIHSFLRDLRLMLTHVEFRSSAFPPYESEFDEINPGRYGKRLAEYLAAGLRREGEIVGEPGAEDWGWVVPVAHDE